MSAFEAAEVELIAMDRARSMSPSDLLAEVEKLRAALREVADRPLPYPPEKSLAWTEMKRLKGIAKKALGQEETT
jgi:hypothetical protein